MADFLVEIHDTHHPVAANLYYEDQKREARRRTADFLKNRAPKFLGYFEQLLAKNSRGERYLAGRTLTYADLSMFQIMAGLHYAFPRAMRHAGRTYRRLCALCGRVQERPRIAAYLQSPRRIAFNEQGIFRHNPELDAGGRTSIIAGHEAVFDVRGRLKRTAWNAALARELEFYRQCPRDHGYPRFVLATFLDGEWTPIPERTDTIPSTQNGMGILSYLKFYELRGKQDPALLQTARFMGDYLVKESLTPNAGRYPAFTRSTGKRDQFPLSPDCGSQADRPYEIEPDKGGIAGYAAAAVVRGGKRAAGTWIQALQNARVLADNQQEGGALASPWPFRVDYRSGAGRIPVSGNMIYILRLYDALLEKGYEEFSAPRQSRWTGSRIIKFRARAPTARFLPSSSRITTRPPIEPPGRPQPRAILARARSQARPWVAPMRALLEFVRRNFTHVEFGVTVCHEQDEDQQAWGGINSTYGAVLALYARAIDSASWPATPANRSTSRSI